MKSEAIRVLEFLGGKNFPNTHEQSLINRAQYFIKILSEIPGVESICICNSLSYYATNRDSDIDLFIITHPNMLWYVRFFVTMKLKKAWVWRKGEDIAGNFCLSFFVTTHALDFSAIAIEDDIYLYYWIYFLKPIVNYDHAYENFIAINNWVSIPREQIQENTQYVTTLHNKPKVALWQYWVNAMLKLIFLPKTLFSYYRLWCPKGVIITRDMLKFHDTDSREYIRDMYRNGSRKYRKNF